MKNIVLLFGIILLLSACASKRYTKQAAKFEAAGLYEDAAGYYYEAVKRKDSNVEAKLGLRKNGQLTLEKKLEDFMKAYQGANYQDAVYKYRQAENYYLKIKKVGVDLNFPDNYQSYYLEAKDDFLNKKYADGIDKLNREDFSGARTIFEEIIKIDAGYKDVKEKNIIAQYEPVYREAGSFLEKQQYRKAYYKYEEILTGTGGYKQSDVLKDEAREKGTITILITDFSYSSQASKESALAFTSKLRGQLGKLKNPFIKVIDPSVVSSDMFEKGKINLEAAYLAGMKAVVSGTLVEISQQEGKLKKSTQKAYYKEVIKSTNSEGQEIEKIVWHKTTYEEFEMENTARLNLNYKMISSLNGEVLISDGINISNSDKIHYAKYDGDKKNLVPGYWKNKESSSTEDVIKNNPGDIKNLKNLLDARQKIKTTSALSSELIDHAIAGIVQKVDAYNPENK